MSSNKKIILTSIVFGIISLVFVILIIYPLINEIKSNSAAFISQKEEIASLQIKIENLKKFKEIYQSYQKNLEKIDTLFINPEVPTSLITFTKFLRKTAKDSQILMSFSFPIPKKEIGDDPWPSIIFQISCTGKFSNLNRFLEKLEAAPYLIEIPDLTLRRLTEREIKSISKQAIAGGKVPVLGDLRANFPIKVYTR